MIDWLQDDHHDPQVELSDRTLPIAIRRHPRAKRLTMRLAPDGEELRVTLPRWGRTRDALVFARARIEWIEQQLARIPQAITVEHGAALPFRGRDLRIDWQEKARRKPQLAEDRLVLGGPTDSLASRIRRWLEAEALDHLARDLAHYCDRDGQDVPDLRLSRAHRRWGSCTGERDSGRCIRINWRLIMAPDHVRRSVVAHEVAHLTHFDHSPAFHARLGTIYDGDLTAADRWLKQQGRTLYAVFG